MLSEEKIQEYVSGEYNHCPYCGSDNISAEAMDVDGNTATQRITCYNCEKQWFDEYILNGIYEREE